MVEKKRNISLDVLKCMSCLAVIILHVAGNNSGIFNRILYYLSSFAVPVFFLLNKNNIGYKYVCIKVLRIIKVTFIWNVMVSIAMFIILKRIENPIVETAKNFIQEGYFWQFWFFGALIIIYCFLPLIHKVFKNIKYSVIIVGIFIIFSVIIDVISLVRVLGGRELIQINIIQTFRIWTWFAYFSLGGLLGKEEVLATINSIFIKVNMKKKLIFFVLYSAFVVAYEIFISSYIYKIKFAEYYYDNIIMFIWIISIFYLINSIKITNIKIIRFIDFFSENIIGIYILHVTVIMILDKVFKFTTSIMNIISIFIVCLISLGISCILNKIEPLKRLIKI